MPKNATRIFMAIQIIGLLLAVIAWTFFRGAAVSAAAQPKTDPCRAIHENALITAEKANATSFRSNVQAYALLSISYTLAYQNCRDLERQR